MSDERTEFERNRNMNHVLNSPHVGQTSAEPCTTLCTSIRSSILKRMNDGTDIYSVCALEHINCM